MATIATEIIISATPEAIWKVLSNFSDYPNWNTFFLRIQGQLAVGNTLEIEICPPKSKPMTFKPEVTMCDTAKIIQWRGNLLTGWLFQGEHRMILASLADGSTCFKHQERFTGLLVPLFNWLGMKKNTLAGFEQFNQQLKAKVENLNAPY